MTVESPLMAKDMQPLTVRFTTDVLDELEDRAKSEGQTKSDVVRRFVDEALSEINRTEEVLAEVKELRRDMNALREALANVALALLTRDDHYSLKEAKRWVEDTILKPHQPT